MKLFQIKNLEIKYDKVWKTKFDDIDFDSQNGNINQKI
jgi:hypothetical protein